MICGQCKTAQSVSKDSSVFVCLNCHAVNRLLGAIGVVQDDSSIVQDVPIDRSEAITLRRVNSSTYVQAEDGAIAEAHADQAPIAPCSVCMDGPGDMIFQKCNHGGFCEACARHIAQNMAVGGAHCPRCREGISKVVRIVEIDKDVVKAVNVQVQTTDGNNKAPPKVPPPRGFNKAKKQ